jgi:hypothetical protein
MQRTLDHIQLNSDLQILLSNAYTNIHKARLKQVDANIKLAQKKLAALRENVHSLNHECSQLLS